MRSYFDLDPALVYLNSANLSITHKKVNAAIAQHRATFERNPSAGLDEAWEKLWNVQKHLAAFLDASPNDLFLRANVTQVLNAILLGIDIANDNEILIGEHEYGSIINICRLRNEQRGTPFRLLKMPSSPAAFRAFDDESFVAHVESQLQANTKVLVLSHVVAGTGYVIPVEKIARLTRAREIFFVVDGAYAPGALDVKLRDLGADAYGCSLYKWMLGPKGTAFGWIDPRLQNRLRPITAGWTTFDTFGPFARFGGGSRFQEQFALSGCLDFSPFFALRELLDFWEERGATEIRKLLFARKAELHKFIEWLPLLSDRQREKSPMLSYRMPTALQAEGATLKARWLTEGCKYTPSPFGVNGM